MFRKLFSKVITVNLDSQSDTDVQFDGVKVVLNAKDCFIKVSGDSNDITIYGDGNNVVITGNSNTVSVDGVRNRVDYINQNTVNMEVGDETFNEVFRIG